MTCVDGGAEIIKDKNMGLLIKHCIQRTRPSVSFTDRYTPWGEEVVLIHCLKRRRFQAGMISPDMEDLTLKPVSEKIWRERAVSV